MSKIEKTRKLESLQNDRKVIFGLLVLSVLCGFTVFGFAVYMGWGVYEAMHMAFLAVILPGIPIALSYMKGYGIFDRWQSKVLITLFSWLCIWGDFSANFMGVVHHYETDQKQVEVAKWNSEAMKKENNTKLELLETEKQERINSVTSRFSLLKAPVQARIDEEAQKKATAEKHATDQEFGRNGVKQGMGPGWRAAKADAASADNRKKEAEAQLADFIRQEKVELEAIETDIRNKITSVNAEIANSNNKAEKDLLTKTQELNPIELYMRNHVGDKGWKINIPKTNKEITLTKEAMLNAFFLCIMVFLSFGPPLIFELVVAPLVKKLVDIGYEIKVLKEELEREELEEIQTIQTTQDQLGTLADEIERVTAQNAILAEKLNMARVLHWTQSDKMKDVHRLARGTRDQVIEYLESYECEFDVPNNYDKLDRDTKRNLMISLVSAVIRQCASRQNEEVFEMVA